MELDRDRLRTIGWIAAAVLVAVLGVRFVTGGAEEAPPVTLDVAPGNGTEAGAQDTAAPAAPLLVQVAGEVARPGVYQVRRGARVQDAVEQAGGLTRRADQAGVNLVARVADGQQVVVPRRGAAVAVPGSGSAGPGAGGQKVGLGSATPEQLDAIDGIGPTLARRIVEYRQQHGGFRSVDELRQVDGIGQKRFEALRGALTP